MLLLAGCYGGAVDPEPECAPGISTLDPTPGDCVVIRDNPLVPGCGFQVAFVESALEATGALCIAVHSDGRRMFMRDAEVTYGPLAPGEACSCSYVSRSR